MVVKALSISRKANSNNAYDAISIYYYCIFNVDYDLNI